MQATEAIPRPSVDPAIDRGATLLPRPGFLDGLALFADVVFPTLAKGVIMRRRGVMALAERFDLDRRAIRRMQRLRDQYGAGPLLVRVPGRWLAFILDPDDVHRVLAQTPEPFAAASAEKRSALAHFEPNGVLISSGAERAERRRYNEEVLDANRPVHHLATGFLKVVASEADRVRAGARARGELTWDEFADAWFRMVRRVVCGDSAAGDDELSALMAELRSKANWAFAAPRRETLRRRLLGRIRAYIERAESGSLAAVMARTPHTGVTAAEQQPPQWLFAFDPAGMATFRSLALLASRAEYMARARDEVAQADRSGPGVSRFLRAAVLESLRLWPTTPLLLRETTTATIWRNGVMPPNTAVVIYTPFFHRDDERLPYADAFSPDLWMRDDFTHVWPLVPFSEGPAICPGRWLVLLLSTAMLARLLETSDLRLKQPNRLTAGGPLPATLNHYGLRFAIRA
jgi:cytochrome P450